MADGMWESKVLSLGTEWLMMLLTEMRNAGFAEEMGNQVQT